MPTSTKPRRRRQQRPAGPAAVSSRLRKHARGLRRREIRQILQPIRAAVTAITTGTATEVHTAGINTAIHMLEAAARVRVIHWHPDMLQIARMTHDAIRTRGWRTGTWRAPTCYGYEIRALQDLLQAAEQLLPLVTEHEFELIEKRFRGLVGSRGYRIVEHSAEAA